MSMIEVTDVEQLGAQLQELNARAEALAQQHRQLLGRRPDLALAALSDAPGSRDQLGSLDAELVAVGLELRDVGDAVRALTQQFEEAEQREQAEHESRLAQEAYTREVQALAALRQKNRDFVKAATAFWEAWGAFESDQELALALHRFHFLGISRATDHQKSLLLGRLAGDLSLGANPLQGEGDLEP